MIESVQIKRLLDRYHENKLSHAFLLETNNPDKCFNDLILFLKMINCPFEYKDNCNEECNLCNLINKNILPSLIVIEPDGSYIKKNQVLEMMDKFSSKPVFSKYNMYIFKKSDRFNPSSGNTILKFLEEPEDGILGFFITNNKENMLSTIRSRCQIISCIYDGDNLNIDDEVLDQVKIYLNSIYKNNFDIVYNKTNMSSLYKERSDWEIFFNTMLYYFKDCLENKRNDKIDLINEISNSNIVNIIVFVEDIIKYIKSNGNIDLILDKFVIEMRKYYE